MVEVLDDESVKYTSGTARAMSSRAVNVEMDEEENWVLLLSLSPMQWLWDVEEQIAEGSVMDMTG